MALFLLTLGLSLVSGHTARAPRASAGPRLQVSGIWYPVSVASDDIKRIEENGDLRVFIRNIESLGDGRLRFHFHTMVHGECEHVAMVCEKAERDGEYSVSHEGDNTVLLLETDYRQYITFHLRNVRNGTQTTVLALYGRVPDLDPSFLDRFEKVCRKYGLGPQNIISLGNQGEPPASCASSPPESPGASGLGVEVPERLHLRPPHPRLCLPRCLFQIQEVEMPTQA
uniref:Lipocalin/cytosolic fatty-acid binding domain-containing protein n=1 Tax=Panthera leo TaxID=9689 RepID=A0A8C9D7H2_PANLE